MGTKTTIAIIDWDWADSNADDPCTRDGGGRSTEASVKVGTVQVVGVPTREDHLWEAVNAADVEAVSYQDAEAVAATIARLAEEGPAYLLAVIRDERITGGFIR